MRSHIPNINTIEVSAKDRVITQGSRGNQPKWLKGGKWYKADYLGHEGLAEYICSRVLALSSVKNFIRYTPVIIKEVESKKEYRGCVSDDFGVFLNGEVMLLRLPQKYNVFLEPRKNLMENIKVFCHGVQEIFKVDITQDFITMLQFDQVICNEDRILRNFGLREDEGSFFFHPLFDQGLSLLSDISSNERCFSTEDIVFKPFYLPRPQMLAQGLGEIFLGLKKSEILSFKPQQNVYSGLEVDKMMDTLIKSMKKTEGIFWNNI